MDFLVYILQELFDMFYKIRGKEGDREFLEKFRMSFNRNVSSTAVLSPMQFKKKIARPLSSSSLASLEFCSA